MTTRQQRRAAERQAKRKKAFEEVGFPPGVSDYFSNLKPATAAEVKARGVDLDAIDRASEDDRRWFDEHSERRYRLRPLFPGENGFGASTHTLVIQVMPGLRLRSPIFFSSAGPLPLDADDELERVAQIAIAAGRTIRVDRAGRVSEWTVQ